MRNTFKFKTGIPHDFALSIMFIVSDENKSKSWDIIRYYFKKGEPVFDWIASILKDNDINRPKNNLGWWKSKLQGN